jgi:4-carboxymuconolactone decarboxylase
MGRLRHLQPEEMSARQRELYDRIAAKRGAVRGPFNAWLYSPELCDKVEALGKFVRYEASFPMTVREIAVLVIARHFKAQYMWQAHAKIAVKEGVSQSVVDAIGDNRLPPLNDQPGKAGYRYTRELLETHGISDETFEAARKEFGDVGVVELTAFIGNFTTVALALNAFQVDLPSDAGPLLA